MQGINNAHAGLSQLQAVDGVLSNISTILDPLQTLATESVSSTLTGNQSILNKEHTGLLSEITRQATNINLNTGDTFNNALTVFIGGGASDSESTQRLDGRGGSDLNGANPRVKEALVLNLYANSQATTLTKTIVRGHGTAISSTDISNQFNSKLSAYSITAGSDGDGTPQLRGATAFNVEDESPSPSLISSIAHGTPSSSSDCVIDGQTLAAASDFLPQASSVEELLFQTGTSEISRMLTWRLQQPDLSKSQVHTQTARLRLRRKLFKVLKPQGSCSQLRTEVFNA